MTSPPLDVVAIGNAIVDVLSHAEDAFLADWEMAKGAMILIDAERAETLYASMGPGVAASGGSAGNTIAGIASLGGRAGYIGKVCDDQLGRLFTHDIRTLGVEFTTPPITDAPPTARCLILVTPDAQRTMNTYLGACVELGPEDVDPELIGRAKVTYMEGYLWDKERAKQAFVEASRIAHAKNREISLTLSDSFCVDRHRDSFRDLVANHVDVLFSNAAELTSLYQVASEEDAVEALRADVEVGIMTRSERGAVIVQGPATFEIEAEPIDRLVDTTGAGDLFAAGFLYGYTQGKHLAECGRLGAICAAEVLGQMGPRPTRSLATLVAEKMG